MGLRKALVAALVASGKTTLKVPLLGEPGGPFSCAYPLDADSAEIMGLALSPLTMTNEDVTASYTLVGGPMVNVTAVAAASGFSNGSSAKLDFTAGRRVIEYVTSVPVAEDQEPVGDASEVYRLSVGVFTPALANVVTAAILAMDDGTFRHRVFRGAGLTLVYGSASLEASAELVALVMDAGGSIVGVKFDDVEVTLDSAGYTPAELISLIVVNEKTNAAAGDADKVISATQRTYFSDFTGTYTEGDTDPCENAIPV